MMILRKDFMWERIQGKVKSTKGRGGKSVVTNLAENNIETKSFE